MRSRMKATQRGLCLSLIVLATAGLPVRGQYAGGAGTADDPYLIETAEQLNAIGLRAEDWSKHFRLVADIDMNDLGETPVNLISKFKGVFDGNDHTIANLVYHVKDEDSPGGWSVVDDIGFFRVISGWDALVKDLGLIGPDVRPDSDCTKTVDNIGALVGSLDQGWVRNCYVKGGHVLGRDEVGGLAGGCYNDAAVSQCWSTAEVSGRGTVGGLLGFGGRVSVWSCHAGARVSGVADVGGLVGFLLRESTIEDSFTTGTISAPMQAGGLAGRVEEASVSRCYSTASVSGGPGSFSQGGLVGVNHGVIRASWAGGEVAGDMTIGGLVGYNEVGGSMFLPYFDATVADCYATGAVHGDMTVGGLIGSNEGTLLRCYSTGAVTTNGKQSLGGLVATDRFVPEWDILGCFWDKTTSGVVISKGGTGMTTAQMQDLAIYLDASWDFVGETANGTEDLWKMPDEGPAYPKLAWEEAPASDPNGVD